MKRSPYSMFWLPFDRVTQRTIQLFVDRDGYSVVTMRELYNRLVARFGLKWLPPEHELRARYECFCRPEDKP